MFDNIIAYSVKNKFVVGLFVAALIVWGLFSLKQLPIDAVPDITNNQVQIITISPTLATQEVEQFTMDFEYNVNLTFAWDKTKVTVAIEFTTAE